MKSLRNTLYTIKNTLDYLDPNRSVSVDRKIAKDAWTDIQMFLLQCHSQVDVVEDIFKLLGVKNSGDSQ